MAAMSTISGPGYGVSYNGERVILSLCGSCRDLRVSSWDEARTLAERFCHVMRQYRTTCRRAAALSRGEALIGGPAFRPGADLSALAARASAF